MKIIVNEKEGPFVDARGFEHSDSGDPWHAYMPEEFWTEKARALFRAALDAGIFQPCEGVLPGGREPLFVSKLDVALLAWWCVRASFYLGLDRGNTTNWKPFEEALGLARRSLSRATGPLDIDRNADGQIVSWREDYTCEIDAFFDALGTEPPRATHTSTESKDNNSQTI